MNEIKFNSQVCTTKEQSQHLLALGLKPETADMYIFGNEVYIGKPNVDGIPAWSLHRLLEIYNTSDDDCCVVFIDTAFDDLIDDIEWCINKGYLNKEYLKQ